MRYSSVPVLFLVCLLLSACTAATPVTNPPATEPLAQVATPAPTAYPVPAATRAPSPAPTAQPTERPTMVPEPSRTAEPTLDASLFQLVSPGPDWPGGQVGSMALASDGALWVATAEGVGYFQDGAWTTVRKEPGRLAGPDGAGRAWWVADGEESIAAWDGAGWTTYGAAEGWLPWPVQQDAFDPIMGGVATDRRGWTWLVIGGEARVFDGQSWTVYTLDQIGFTAFTETADYDGFWLTDVVADSEGDIWISDCDWQGEVPEGQGARWYDGERWGGDTSEATATGCAMDLAVDAAGNIWVPQDSLLWRYTPGQGWASFEPPECTAWGGCHLGPIEALDLDPQGNPWPSFIICGGAGCHNGSARYRLVEGAWTQIFADYEPNDVAFSADGTAWVCTAKGTFRVSGEQIEQVSQFPTGGWCTIVVDRQGTVWMSTGGEDLWVYRPE